MGRYDDAVQEFAEAARLSGNRQAAHVLAFALGRAGRTSEARRILDEMRGADGDSVCSATATGPDPLGAERSRSGDRSPGKRAHPESYWMVYLRADPIYGCIRAHPARILLSMKLRLHGAAAARP